MVKLICMAFSTLIALTISISANATIYVNNIGSTGPHSFYYEFDEDLTSVEIVAGVSNQGDFSVQSFLELSSFGGLLSGTSDVTFNSDKGEDTSMFSNTLGESGTSGDIGEVVFDNIVKGDFISFEWSFSTLDYDPFNDFAFIQIGGDYQVLAEIARVPAPATALLMALGLLALRVGRSK